LKPLAQRLLVRDEVTRQHNVRCLLAEKEPEVVAAVALCLVARWWEADDPAAGRARRSLLDLGLSAVRPLTLLLAATDDPCQRQALIALLTDLGRPDALAAIRALAMVACQVRPERVFIRDFTAIVQELLADPAPGSLPPTAVPGGGAGEGASAPGRRPR